MWNANSFEGATDEGLLTGTENLFSTHMIRIGRRSAEDEKYVGDLRFQTLGTVSSRHYGCR